MNDTPVILPPTRSEDVVIYRRHSSDCTRKNDCDCPLWLYIKATQKRISARTTSWQRAEIERNKILDSYNPLKRRVAELERKHEYESVLISDAIKKYLDWKRADGVAESTLQDYGSSVGQMEKFMHNHGIVELRAITRELMIEWKAKWADKRMRSRHKKAVHIRALFRFCCVTQRWMDQNDNPGDALLTSRARTRKAKAEEVVPAIPFYEDQFEALLEAASNYDLKPRTGAKRICTAKRLHALIQLMRWSGLAILDAVNLQRSRIDKDGLLTVRRAKTFEPVTVPLPPHVLEELRALPVESQGFFYDDNHSGNARSRTACYSTAFLQLFPTVKWPRPVADGEGNPIRPHSHMLRHTFAYDYLKRGLDIRKLQILLGHSKLATTEENYAQWTGDARKQLNDEVRSLWAAPGVEKREEPNEPRPEHRVRVRHAAAGRLRSKMSR